MGDKQMVVFRSYMRSLTLHSAPIPIKKVVGGQVIESSGNKFSIHFADHFYRSDNAERIAFLRNHKLAGKEFYEDIYPNPAVAKVDAGGNASSAASSPNPSGQTGDATPVDVPGIKSRNTAIAWLVGEKGADAKEFKGKKAEQIAILALEKFGVRFIDWNS